MILVLLLHTVEVDDVFVLGLHGSSRKYFGRVARANVLRSQIKRHHPAWALLSHIYSSVSQAKTALL